MASMPSLRKVIPDLTTRLSSTIPLMAGAFNSEARLKVCAREGAAGRLHVILVLI